MLERIKIILNLFNLVNKYNSYYFVLGKKEKEKTIIYCREADPQDDMGYSLEIDTKIKNKKDFNITIIPEEFGPKTLFFDYQNEWKY